MSFPADAPTPRLLRLYPPHAARASRARPRPSVLERAAVSQGRRLENFAPVSAESRCWTRAATRRGGGRTRGVRCGTLPARSRRPRPAGTGPPRARSGSRPAAVESTPRTPDPPNIDPLMRHSTPSKGATGKRSTATLPRTEVLEVVPECRGSRPKPRAPTSRRPHRRTRAALQDCGHRPRRRTAFPPKRAQATRIIP